MGLVVRSGQERGYQTSGKRNGMEPLILRVVTGEEVSEPKSAGASASVSGAGPSASPGQVSAAQLSAAHLSAAQLSAAVMPVAAPPAVSPWELTAELQAELRERNEALEGATPQEILRWATERFGDKFTMATAFGPEGMVLIHMLAEIAPRTRIFNLDTGYQFQETLDLRERVKVRYGIEVEMHRPDLTVEQYEALHGGPVYKSNPDQCCADRKLAVLKRSVIGMHAWASAIRRDQSPDRAQAPIVGWDKKFNLVKVSPLANWTKKDVWKLITDRDIPYNLLHDQGYPSIGCWPCTRAVMFGEDERAGRWSGFKKTECGLHSIEEPPARDKGMGL